MHVGNVLALQLSQCGVKAAALVRFANRQHWAGGGAARHFACTAVLCPVLAYMHLLVCCLQPLFGYTFILCIYT